MSNEIDIVFSFDTTGSMSPCIAVVRKKVKEVVERLFSQLGNLRIGIISHGDYCDGKDWLRSVDLTDNQSQICSFIQTSPNTHGGDAAEAYEYVLHHCQKLSWRKNSKKILVMIGDDVPHSPNVALAQNGIYMDWQKELDSLRLNGIIVYGVQALEKAHATSFYQTLALKTDGYHIELNQFNQSIETLMAIAYKQHSNELLERFEGQLIAENKVDRNLDAVFTKLLNRDPKTGRFISTKKAEIATLASRFQVMDVDSDSRISDFVNSMGITFNPGRGFYEFTKSETIQGKKEIVVQHKSTGDIYFGLEARKLIGLPTDGSTVKRGPTQRYIYNTFIQSTSYTRKLIGGTKFLYEVK